MYKYVVRGSRGVETWENDFFAFQIAKTLKNIKYKYVYATTSLYCIPRRWSASGEQIVRRALPPSASNARFLFEAFVQARRSHKSFPAPMVVKAVGSMAHTCVRLPFCPSCDSSWKQCTKITLFQITVQQ